MNDLPCFILHQAGVIREAVKALRDYPARKKQERQTAGDRLQGMQDLNHRQPASRSAVADDESTRPLDQKIRPDPAASS